MTRPNTAPNVLWFVVPGPVRGKERPRFCVRARRPNEPHEERLRVYTPPRTKQYERAIGQTARLRVPPGWQLDGQFRVSCVFTFSSGRHPDVDNALKAVLDGLESIVFANDRQVVETSARKVIYPGGEESTEVQIERIGDMPKPKRTRRVSR